MREPIFVPDGYHIVIDTKVVMLMPGMYPCIGGWHADAIERKNGQPDLSTLNDNKGTHFIYSASTCVDSQT